MQFGTDPKAMETAKEVYRRLLLRSPIDMTIHGGRSLLHPKLLFTGALVCAATSQCRRAPRTRAPFLAENNAAMTKMMAAMDVKPTGDADKDFVATMVPHHRAQSTCQSRYCVTATTSSSSALLRKSS